MTKEERAKKMNRERQKWFRRRHPDYHKRYAQQASSPTESGALDPTIVVDEDLLRDWEEAIAWEKQNKRTRKNHYYRAKRKNGYWEPINYITLWQQRGELCHHCRQRVEYLEAHWHHDHELSRGGYTVAKNLYPYHRGCHTLHTKAQIKANKKLLEMIESLPDWWPDDDMKNYPEDYTMTPPGEIIRRKQGTRTFEDVDEREREINRAIAQCFGLDDE